MSFTRYYILREGKQFSSGLFFMRHYILSGSVLLVFGTDELV